MNPTGPVVVAIVFSLAVTACGSDPTQPGPASPYLPPTSPENVLQNLEVAYGLRDASAYSNLLAPEFIFMYQPRDVTDIENEYWTRDQDSTATQVLLACPSATSFCLEFVDTHPETSYVDTWPELRLLQVPELHLAIGLADDTTLCLNFGRQDIFFRSGESTIGEDPSRWYLLEWRAVPDVSADTDRHEAQNCPCGSGNFTDVDWRGDWRDRIGCQPDRP